MHDDIRCDNCGQVWEEHDLDPIHDYWERVEPGGVVPLGQCPDLDCRALCYPAYGHVHDLEQQLATTRRHLVALQDVVSQLLDWAAAMGGWDASCWVQARRAMAACSRSQVLTADLGADD